MSQFQLFRVITDAGTDELVPYWSDLPIGRMLEEEHESSDKISDRSLDFTYNVQIGQLLAEVCIKRSRMLPHVSFSA